MSRPMFAMSIVRTGLREKIEKGICVECSTPITEIEQTELNGFCRSCHRDNQEARFPSHPDNRRA